MYNQRTNKLMKPVFFGGAGNDPLEGRGPGEGSGDMGGGKTANGGDSGGGRNPPQAKGKSGSCCKSLALKNEEINQYDQKNHFFEILKNKSLEILTSISNVFFGTVEVVFFWHLGLFLGFHKADSKIVLITFLVLSGLAWLGGFTFNQKISFTAFARAGALYSLGYVWGLDYYKYFNLFIKSVVQ